MKKIIIRYKGEDVELLYKVVSEYSEYGTYSYTDFFDTKTQVVRKKKYWFFGPYISKTEQVFLFRIWYNANDPQITKEEWREKILRQLELLHRRRELEEGILI